MDQPAVQFCWIQQGEVGRPKLVKGVASRRLEEVDRLPGSDRLRILGLANDTHKTILSDGARCPTGRRLPQEPLLGSQVMHVGPVQQSQQHIYIEERSQLAPAVVFE